MKLVCNILLLLLFVTLSTNSFALNPEIRLQDEIQERRALELFKQVKCLVCQGQSIFGSNTEFSANLRKIIRQKIANGLTDHQVKEHLESEFGEQILFYSESSSFGNRLLILLPIILSAILLYFFTRKVNWR